MASRALVSDEAMADLETIVSYLAETLAEPGAAGGVLDAFDEFVRNVSTFPEMYPPVREPRLRRLGYRKAVLGKYIALYRVQDETVLVAHVFHQSQDYAKLV